jgi:galactokinase
MERAKIGQEAEHLFWGKPVGLLDQLACGTGGIIELDFADRVSPKVSPIEFDFSATGYELVTVDPGGDHSDLTEEYAAVPKEMFAVAHALGAERLKDRSEVSLLSGIAKLRKVVGDRAIARALHFFGENRRVSQQVQALKQGDLARFVSLVRESGSSSWRLLQNCFVPGSSTHQPIMLALSLAERLLGSSDEGAARVHGGGFAGMILVVLQRHRVAAFRAAMDGAFGKGASKELAVRKLGTVNLARMG